MLFSSVTYIFFFLPITFFVYFYLQEKRLHIAAQGFLVLASLFFYAWWNILYLPIILFSMLVNYVLGNLLAQKSLKMSKKVLLSIGILGNILALVYFKYMDFFIENVNFILDGSIPLFHLALPLALSFFTFQQIAFLVDSYKGETREYDFLRYALFVTFFPQLIAGPIVHHKEMMPQFASKWNQVKRYKNVALGIFIFSIGLFKKIVIADSFSPIVSNGFDHSVVLTLVESWMTSLSYTLQLYFDFSGYTDMAIGSALLFNIKLPVNFNSPYKASNIQEFWKRWHMTLSRFLRDYIYIPLGGNKETPISMYTNLFITFLLGGIWHGAGWTFLIWGALHGAATVIHKLWVKLGFELHIVVAWFITFNFINISWVFFRARNFEDAQKVLEGMLGMSGISLPYALQPYLGSLTQYGVSFGEFVAHIHASIYLPLFLFFGLCSVLILPNSNSLSKKFKVNYIYFIWTIIMAFTAFLFAMYFNVSSEFIYFQF